MIGHEVKYCDKPRAEETEVFQYGEWLKAGYRRTEEVHRNRNQGKTMSEAARKEETAPTVTLEEVSVPTHVSVTNVVNPETHGNDTEISTDHTDMEQDNQNRSYIPNKTEVKFSDKAEELVIKEDASIVIHPEFVGEHLFTVPILDVGTTQISNSKEDETKTQTSETFSGKHVSKGNNEETKWKRAERKVGNADKVVVAILGNLGKKRGYPIQNKTGKTVERRKSRDQKYRMSAQISVQRRRLIPSPTERNDYLKLELSGD